MKLGISKVWKRFLKLFKRPLATQTRISSDWTPLCEPHEFIHSEPWSIYQVTKFPRIVERDRWDVDANGRHWFNHEGLEYHEYIDTPHIYDLRYGEFKLWLRENDNSVEFENFEPESFTEVAPGESYPGPFTLVKSGDQLEYWVKLIKKELNNGTK